MRGMRGIFLFAAAAVLVLNLCACGAKDEKDVKKEAGKKAEEQKAERRREFLKHSFAGALTEKCMYEATEEGEILQKDLQGKELDRHKVPLERGWRVIVEAATRNWLLYSIDILDDGGRDILYRCPIKQTKAGETVLWEQAEKLARVRWATDGSGSCLWLQEPYLVYHNFDQLVRLNLETGEKKTLDFQEEIWCEPSIIGNAEEGYLYLHADGLKEGPREDRDEGEHDSLYRIDIEQWKAEKVYSNEDGNYRFACHTMSGKNVLLTIGAADYVDQYHYFERMEYYDTAQKKALGTLSRKEIGKFLDQKKLFGVKQDSRDLWITMAFGHRGRIYFACRMCYDAEEERDRTKPDDVRDVLLSCPEGDLSALSYEEDISEWWYGNTEKQMAENESSNAHVIHLGGFVAAFENELYVSYRDPKKHGEHLMLYDLDTGKMREVGRKELAYQVMYSSMETEYWEPGEYSYH